MLVELEPDILYLSNLVLSIFLTCKLSRAPNLTSVGLKGLKVTTLSRDSHFQEMVLVWK